MSVYVRTYCREVGGASANDPTPPHFEPWLINWGEEGRWKAFSPAPHAFVFLPLLLANTARHDACCFEQSFVVTFFFFSHFFVDRAAVGLVDGLDHHP